MLLQRFIVALACLVLMQTACISTRADEDTGKAIQLISPLDGATVRETVSVRVPRASFPASGYVTVTIDGNFIEATAFPDEGDVVYEWDTKAPYTLPNDPDKKLHLSDGDHTITIKIFNRDNTVDGTASAKVRIANTIPELKDGVKLLYQWSKTQDLRYHRTTQLDMLDSNLGVPPTPIQKSDIRFRRTVEDSDASGYLVRDMVLDNGLIITKGNPATVQNAYLLKGRMRTVSLSGATVSNNTPINSNGSHFGFPIPAFPARRIQVGDSWETPIEMSLQWACERPTALRGTARLDSFEWEDAYPCAKIIETFSGPATFNLYSPSGDIPPVQGATVKVTRTVWFAYTSGRLIHISTDAKVDATMTSGQIGALGGELSQQAPAQDAAGINPFTPTAGPNPAGNMGQLPGPSTDTGQAKAQVSFHITEELEPMFR